MHFAGQADALPHLRRRDSGDSDAGVNDPLPPTPDDESPLAAPAPLPQRPIVLVGMMGSGKSTVGRRLAQRLGRRFADADDEIERAAGMTISEMFERYGEPYFRDGEQRVIARLMRSGPIVLATGGGAFVQDDTRRLILDHGLAIWLDVPIDVLVDRVARRSHRPLLHGKDPRTVLNDLMAVRGPAYAQAPLHVASDHAPHDRTVDTILSALKAHGALP